MNNQFDRETQAIVKGENFGALLTSDLFQDGIEEAKQRLFNLFGETCEDQTLERENIYWVMKALDAIRNSLEAASSESEMLADYRENEVNR
ncbi:MAG: hypothetical protein DRP93_00215 [Candidatus Neomarinimicrobiota bacterium]|nr:MAG: hypothetical protein DRP93_00215 [Candidatus Neomarinimicrobiota bacterium]